MARCLKKFWQDSAVCEGYRRVGEKKWVSRSLGAEIAVFSGRRRQES
jgi:hypothetical protein